MLSKSFLKALMVCLLLSPLLCVHDIQPSFAPANSLAGKKMHIQIQKDFPEVVGVGWGDIVMFMPLYEEYLKQQGAEVVVSIPQKLQPFFEQASSMQMYNECDNAVYEAVELVDLYYEFSTRVQCARAKPMLTCPQEFLIKWDEVLSKQCASGCRPVIFFTSGNTMHNPGRFPSAGDFLYLTQDMPGFHFINAQFKGDAIANSVSAASLIQDFDAVAFMDTVALCYVAVMNYQGYIIACDTGALHFAARILEGNEQAKNTVLMAMKAHPDQRWRNGRMEPLAQVDGVSINKSCWYPSSLLIFQQHQEGDWHAVVDAIKNYLQYKILV